MTKAWTPLLLVLTICQASLILGDVHNTQADDKTETRYRLPTVAAPTKYVLSLEPDLKNFKFMGEATIAINVIQATSVLTLNSKNLKINDKEVFLISVDKQKESLTGTVSLNEELEFLEIKFAKALAKGSQHELKLKYSGELGDSKRGFYRSKYFDKDGKMKYVAVTHFEPTGARSAFPCWDEPAYKAVFQISLNHSSDYTAISNMPQDGDSKALDKTRKITKFTDTPVMSSYLVAFLVSDYGYKANKDGTLRVWTKPQAVEQTEYALSMGEKLLQKLDEYTGIKYFDSMPKMDQASLKDFLPGAMENWGLVTYRERSLLVEDGVSTTRNKQNIASTIAHEFAHQWFGNLVSPKWWEYVWLNEGFADYFEYFITHEVKPEWRLNETFVVDNIQGTAFVADVAENVRPMNKKADSPDEIKSLFDAVAYQKAGSVIRMMSHILKPDVFQVGLRKYLKDMSLKSADPTDLLTSLNEAADVTWGDKVTLGQIMDTWINKPGYPVVTVRKNGVADYVLSQEKFLLHGSPNDTKWWVPITYVMEATPDFKNTTPVVWLKPTDQNVTVKGDGKSNWFILNTQQTGYYRVNYEKENWANLAKHLKMNKVDSIHVLNRAQLIDDALNMARSNRLNYTDALELTLYLNKEADYVPWQTAFRNLNFLQNMLRTSNFYDTFKLYVRYIMKQVTKEVGFEPKKDEADLTKMLRINVMKWACRAGDETCTNYASNQLKAWLKNSTAPLDVDLKNAIVCAGVRSQDEPTWSNTFKALVESIKDEDLRKTALASLACSESAVILKNYLLSSLKKNASVTFDAAAQAIVSEHPKGADIVLDVLNSEYENIKKLNNGDDMIKTSINIVGSAITNKDQFVELSTLLVKQGLKGDLLQAAVTLATKNIEWVNSHMGTIENWMDTHEVQLNSAGSLAITSFLVLISVFITRFY